MAINPDEFRAVLGRFASGVTVLTARGKDGRDHGMTVSAFCSASLVPPLVVACVAHDADMHGVLRKATHFGISILAEGQELLSDHFAGRPSNGLDVQFVRRQDMPVLKGAVAYLICEVADAHPAGDHTLYIGQVEYLEMWDSRPLVFYAGQYRYLDVERLKQPQWPEDGYSLFSITNF